ncbi:gamma-glutamyltranspeptidase periplasmic precursor [Fusarium beomiforme]|uniref:Gamma-glutamyltranspeptidase periplasmic n=1 Tax=Fusarium beomiforme TaxID=44412 RepID=A0A9P5DUM3_9HYPO|nr:gamma-glutamyltranspeptidase periplasmic precursor [Fusarium beomiforme]
MSSKDSYLSDPRCQCDFVVSTTQASINSGLWEYLDEETQPIKFLCFEEEDGKFPTREISLDKLKEKSGGVDPFLIPDNADASNPDVQALVQKTFFTAGIMLQMGIPDGHSPRTLPPIVTLKNASNVTFNLYCKKIKVISLSFGRGGAKWNSFEQPVGPSEKPWSMSMSVDLTTANLAKDLNSPYFLNHPKVREQLLAALKNLSGTAFSLQQLLYDLDNATLQSTPDFSGVTDAAARNILEANFRDIYAKNAAEHGLPLVSLTAVAQTPDKSTLAMTDFELIVNPLKDNNGVPLYNPDDDQLAVTTLDHLCATNNNRVPRISALDWNWVQPQDVDNCSGAISINRDVLANFIGTKLQDLASSLCYTTTICPDRIEISGNGTPVITIPPSTSNVFHLDYSQIDITCAQAGDFDSADCVTTMKVVDKTLTDTYGISVDQYGGLQLVKVDEQLTDQSEDGPTDTWNDDDDDLWMGGRGITNSGQLVKEYSQDIQNYLDNSSAGNLHELQISQLQSFVFPGGRVFTYKAPFFSEHQDLVCSITYLDPEEEQKVDHDSGSNSPETSTRGRLVASTDLMQNYVQGEIISPTNKFEALQTSNGHSLLFGCDTSGVFHVIEEQSGTSHAAWQIHDLSTTAIQNHLGSGAKVSTFDVGQSAGDGTIGMMMAVSQDGDDHLFMSLGNSPDDTSWVSAPAWIKVPFDAVGEQSENIRITGALFVETEDEQQYMVVDIDRPSGTMADAHITRYHIDPSSPDSHKWVKHDVTVDISAGQYQSVVGRVSGKHVDGIYTVGHVGESAQLVYEPIVNWYGKGAPTPIRLDLPGGQKATAIATARNADKSSDLYVVCGSDLYRFASDEQHGNTSPAKLATSDLFNGTDTLRVMTLGGMTTLWGRSRADQVFYLTCPSTRLSEPSAWRPPFAIFSGVEKMSVYVNHSDGGNTIFTSGNGRLQKAMQSSAYTGGIWRSQNITVAASPEQKATPLKSYTTSIHVIKQDEDLTVPNALVQLSAHTRTPVYINGLYYVLSPSPIQVSADITGCLTIIDTTETLHGSILTASLDSNTAITINPTDIAMSKLTALDSASKLRDAQFPRNPVAGGVTDSTAYTPLVDASTSDGDMAAVAQHMGSLREAYSTVEGPAKFTSSAAALRFKSRRVIPTTTLHANYPHISRFWFWDDIKDAIDDVADDIVDVVEDVTDDVVGALESIGDAIGDVVGGIVSDIGDIIDDIGDAISSLPGDIYNAAKEAADVVGGIFKDAATGTLHFFAKIGEDVYHAALNTAHAVASALEWVYDKVKTAVKDLIAFVEMLFEWDDIRRCKDVIHNAFKLWMQHQIDYLPKAKAALDENAEAFKQVLAEWTQNTDVSSFGDVSQNAMGQQSVNPNKDQTLASKLFATHYQNHSDQVQYVGGCPELGSVEDLINDLLAVISQEGAVLDDTFSQLNTLTKDLSSLSVQDVLKRVAAIFLGAAFDSVQVVVDALLNILCKVSSKVISILDAPIRVPIISDILDTVVPNFKMLSFLDLICWIAAMGFTVAHKTIEGSAPFPKSNEYVQLIISAGTWEQLADAFGKSDLSFQKTFFKCSHSIAAFLALIGNPISSAEAMSEASSFGMLSKGATVIKMVATGCQTIGDVLVPRYPVKNEVVSIISHVTTCLGILTSIVFSSVVQSKLKAKIINRLQVANPRGVGAIVHVILVVPRLAVTRWHFYELTKDSTGATLTAAILSEVSSLASCASKISYAVAVNGEDPDSRLIAVTVKAASDDLYSGLQFAESIAGYS